MVDVAVFCGIITLMVPIDDQTEKNGWTKGPLSLIAASLQFLPLFPVLDGMEAALARVPATVVMYNFNVGTRGASKKNFIKCSLKLKFSSEVGLTQSFLLLLSPACPLYIW